MVDLKKDHYYENGYIAKNIINDRGFSLNYDRSNELRPYFNIDEQPFPSAYMPPAYVYYLSIFMTIENIQIRNIALYSSQIILSLFLIFLLFKFINEVFDEKIAIISSLIYAIFPEFIFTIGIANSIIHFQIILIAAVYFIWKSDLNLENSFYVDLQLSIIFALGIYFRSEFLLFFIIYLTYIFYKNKRKSSLTTLLLVVLLLLPWQIRNYQVFDKFVFLTTNSGFNIYRGHYPGDDFQFHIEDKVYDEMMSYYENPNFELIQRDIFTKYAIEFIKSDIMSSILTGFDNIIKFALIQYKDPRAQHPLYLIPWIIMLICSVFGIIKFRGKPINKFIYFFILSNLITVFIFFAIPRYQTSAKIVLLPYFAYGVHLIFNRINVNKAKKILNDI